MSIVHVTRMVIWEGDTASAEGKADLAGSECRGPKRVLVDDSFGKQTSKFKMMWMSDE